MSRDGKRGDGHWPQATAPISDSTWPCENSERAFTEGNRVLRRRGFRVVLLLLARTLGLKKESRSMRSARPSVFTRLDCHMPREVVMILAMDDRRTAIASGV